MYFGKDERLAVFIDGGSLSAAVKALEFDLDFRRISRFFEEAGCLVRIYFYAAVPEERASIRPLIDWLEYHRYSVTAKSGRSTGEDAAKSRNSGDFAVDLAVEAMRLARSLDHLVLVSGDCRYRALVAALQQMGRRVTVISTLKPRPIVDADLRRQADQFIDLFDLRKHFERARADAIAAQ
jgi:uncharacterized LabA/DUF88 family protein